MLNQQPDESERAGRTLEEAFAVTHLPLVLLAEDNPDMRDLLKGALRRDGYQVAAVPDGAALLAAIAARHPFRQTPELIISDVRMPKCSGLDVLKELRRHDWVTPVILITAFGDIDTHRQAARFGAVVLDKPFDLDHLRTAALDLRRLI